MSWLFSLRNKLRRHACKNPNVVEKRVTEQHGPFQKEMIFFREREKSKLATKRGGLVLRNPMILFEGTGAGIRVALMHGIMAIAMPSQRQFTSISGARHRKQEPKTPSPWTGEETPIFFSPRVHYKNTWLARCVRIT
jgi:hypothetical protein